MQPDGLFRFWFSTCGILSRPWSVDALLPCMPEQSGPPHRCPSPRQVSGTKEMHICCSYRPRTISSQGTGCRQCRLQDESGNRACPRRLFGDFPDPCIIVHETTFACQLITDMIGLYETYFLHKETQFRFYEIVKRLPLWLSPLAQLCPQGRTVRDLSVNCRCPALICFTSTGRPS